MCTVYFCTFIYKKYFDKFLATQSIPIYDENIIYLSL